MAKDKKTVYKVFDYTSCDDFARYLEEMALKGWHYSEWTTGLVFKRGEPENVTYAVEVFIDGSEQDIRPGVHTLNFADFCEAAGWKLVDAKRKFCIFRQISPDAEPILTPKERVKNATKASASQLWIQAITSLVLLGIGCLNYFLDANFVNLVFSNTMLLSMGVYVLMVAVELYQLIRFYIWWIRANRKRKAGEQKVLTGSVRIGDWILTGVLVVLYILMYALKKDPLALILPSVYLLILFGSSWLLAKFRPDKETADMIRIGSVVVLFVFYAIYAAVGLAMIDGRPIEPDPKVPEIQYSHINVDYGPRKSSYSDIKASVLGSQLYYSAYYGEGSHKHLGYTLYKVDQDWILDRFWEDQLDAAYNANRTDCTALWDAQMAYVNDQDQYYVRYEDAMLILRLDGVTLDQSQVETILHQLELR